MTLPIGELVAYMSLKGGAEFDAGIMGAQRSLNLAGESATRFGASTDRAAVSSGKLRAAQLSALAANERYNASLAAGNASTAKLASQEASLLRANQRLAASYTQMAAAQREAAAGAYTFAAASERSLGSSIASTARLGVGLAGLAGAFEAVKLIKDANEFQQKMLLIQTNAGQSAAEVKDMTAAVLKLSPQVATGPNELADALYHVEQNGLHGKAALDALTIGAEGAKVGMADVEDTTNAMTFAIASGIKGVQDMDKAMGFLITTVGTGDMRMTDLNEALGTGILSVAKQFGASLQDVSAILATLGDNGIRGVNAAQGLRQVMMGFAKPAKEGAEALKSVGLESDTLAKDMESHGLVHAMNLLEQHMRSGGVTAKETGAFITNAFGRKAGASLAVLVGEMGRVNTKFAEIGEGGNTFASKWDATTKTAGFALSRLGAQAQVVGIEIAEKAAPSVAHLADLFAVALPAGLHIAQAALAPFLAGWHDAENVLGPVAHALGFALDELKPLEPVLKGTAGAVLTMWLAFKGYELARTAVFAVQDSIARMSASAGTSLASMRAGIAGTSAVVGTEAEIMQAEFDAIAASALDSAAVQAEAQLAAMETYEQASTAEIEAMAATAAAARASASAAAASAAESAAAIRAAGAEARVGWASLAGPIGLAAVGVLAVVMAFHKSTAASKEATEAAKAYTDALSGGGGRATILDTVAKQLVAVGIPDELDKINQAFGRTVVGGKSFIDAISKGQPALGALRDHLAEVAKQAAAQQDKFVPDSKGWLHWNDIWQTSNKLLGQLNTQYSALGKAQLAEIKNLNAIGQAVTPLQDVEKVTHVATAAAAKYAAMLGFQVTKNNDVIGSSHDVNAAVREVSDAFAKATQTSQEFLSALQTFSSSAATAADRAALIGATLKAANGDALAYAGSMAGAAGANQQLVASFKQEAGNIADLHSQISQLESQKKLSADDTHRLADLQGQLNDALKNGERAAINLKNGTIDYNKAGAGPLISNLQAIQSAAMSAASATYEHNRAQEGGRQAAIDAYNVYKTQTKQALIDEASQLGLTQKQAKRLADTYFSMNGKKVKTLIEAEGTDPILKVLNKIGKLLANITGQTWNVKVKYSTTGGGPGSATAAEHDYFSAGSANSAENHRAMGGPVLAGHAYIVGEKRPEVFVPNSNGRIIPDASKTFGQQVVNKHVQVDNLHITANYPEPATDKESIPMLARMAANQLDGFGE